MKQKFQIGISVEVTPFMDDDFETFCGTIIEYHGGEEYTVERDSDYAEFDVYESQITDLDLD